MKQKPIIKILVDIAMTVILLFLMAYSLIGEKVHEWLGIGMFILFVLHHILNNKWSRSVFKGKYTPYRILQTVLVVLSLASMLGAMVSGIVISRHALSFLQITGGQSWARTLHMLSAYWGFAFISIHLGLHWGMMIGMAKLSLKKSYVTRAWVVRCIGFLIAGCGVYAFIKRDIGSYMLLKIQFAFFDFDESRILFMLDYIAVMSLFVFVGHYLSGGLKRVGRKKEE